MKRNIILKLYPIFSVILYHVTLIRIPYISNYNSISLALGIILILYLVPKIKLILSKKYANMNIPLLIFALIYIFTAFYNEFNMDGTILYVLKIVEIFIFLEYINEINQTKNVAKIFMFLNIIYLFLTYLIIIKEPLYAWKNNMNYLIGTKFSVSYTALSTLVLYFYAYKDKIKKKNIYKLIGIIFSVLAIFISNRVECSTGIVGNIIFIIIYLFSFENIRNFISKPFTPIISLIIFSSILLLFYNFFVNLPFVKFIIEDVLNKNLTLTGRMYVYDNVLYYIKEGFFFGYGYNSVCRLFNNVMYIGKEAYALTAQNAILEYWLYCGIFGVIDLIIIMYTALKNNYLYAIKKNTKEYYPFIVGLLVLTILGMIEITIDIYFFMFLAFLNLGNIKYEKK